MNLISPFDFVAMMPEGQRIAIIGNAPSLKNSKLGSWIDEHDIVVRFNECAILGFKDDVGERTDILVSNPYAESRSRPILDGESVPKLVLILNPQTRRGDKATFERWVKDLPVLFSYTPDLRGITRERKDISLTTGTFAIPFLERLLKPRHISVAGFTMFLSGTSHHYWNSQSPSGLRAHAPVREAEIFTDLINAIKVATEVTDDVAWVASQVGVPLKKSVNRKQLKGWIPPAARTP